MALAFDILKTVVEKAVKAKMKSNIVDAQLFKCYSDIYFDTYNPDKCIESTKEMAENMLNGIKMFDSYGNPEKIYASLCVFCNRLLTKEEYRKYADLLVKKMVAYSELSSYVNVPVFKENIMKDFDPDKVRFKRTALMVFNNRAVFDKHTDDNFDLSGFAEMYDMAAGTFSIPNMSSYKINLADKIYIYTCTPQLKITRLPDNCWTADIENDTLKVTVKERCTIYIGNKPLKRKSE